MPIVTQTTSTMSSGPGECLCCSLMSKCENTSIDKAINSFTCPAFSPAEEAEWKARVHMMRIFGDRSAVGAILNKEKDK